MAATSVRRHARALLCIIAVAVAAPACGKKGNPLEPLRPVPAAPTEPQARLRGSEVRIQFTAPAQNVSPAMGAVDLAGIEIYAFTVAPGAIIPPNRELMARKYLIKTIEVKPPPVVAEQDPAKPAAPQPPAVQDDRPAPGDRVTFIEPLTAAELTPAIVPKPIPPLKLAKDQIAAPGPPPLLEPPVTTRIYVVRGVSRRGQAGAPSGRLSVPFVQAWPAAADLKVDVTEKEMSLQWTQPAFTVDPALEAQASHAVEAAAKWMAAPLPKPAETRPARGAEAVPPAELPSLRMLPGAPLPLAPPMPVRFNVYEVIDGTPAEQPLNPAPVSGGLLSLGVPDWGRERCFIMRSVLKYGLVSVEGAAAGPVCVTPKDAFPPAAPTGLRVVAAAGVINLIWAPNTEPDFDGYIVLRGEGADETLRPLTDKPIRETTYKDTTVTPGVRYVYALVAVDNATPPNMSAQSPRQEEIAR